MLHRAEDPLAPARFAPERFLTPEGAKQGAHMPFGGGPRMCIGFPFAMAEIKVGPAQKAAQEEHFQMGVWFDWCRFKGAGLTGGHNLAMWLECCLNLLSPWL